MAGGCRCGCVGLSGGGNGLFGDGRGTNVRSR